MPPGGPEDLDPPALVRVQPDSSAVNVREGAVEFAFDDVVSERAQGVSSLADLFVVSPSFGRNVLSWRRTRLAVRPREGFRPNTTYRVTLLPGLTDLDGNVDSVGHSIVFSTGPAIARGVISGRVFEWMEERAAKQAWVEAIVLPDSIRYLAVTDSLGRFEMRNLPDGPYVIRAIVDGNKNRQIDPREAYDTMTVALRDSMDRTLHAVLRDTIGPGIQTVDVTDSLTLRLRFDHPLDTAFVIDTTWLTLRGRDSVAIPLARALGARTVRRLAEDSARAKAREDSTRMANDTTRRADTTRARAAAPPRPAPARTPAGPQPARDTTPPPRPTVAIPETEVIVRLTLPLAPNSNYVMHAEGVRGITRHTRSSARRFQTPRARADTARRDTSRTSRDTARTRRDTLSLPLLRPQ